MANRLNSSIRPSHAHIRSVWAIGVAYVMGVGCIALSGCSALSEGGEGQPCKCANCTMLSGTFYCDDGLICNTGTFSRYLCQGPHSQPQGAPCVAFSNELCSNNLVCTYSSNSNNSLPWTCQPPASQCPANGDSKSLYDAGVNECDGG